MAVLMMLNVAGGVGETGVMGRGAATGTGEEGMTGDPEGSGVGGPSTRPRR